MLQHCGVTWSPYMLQHCGVTQSPYRLLLQPTLLNPDRASVCAGVVWCRLSLLPGCRFVAQCKACVGAPGLPHAKSGEAHVKSGI